jgi:hypothetical protein
VQVVGAARAGVLLPAFEPGASLQKEVCAARERVIIIVRVNYVRGRVRGLQSAIGKEISKPMSGIQFVTDEKGRKTAVLIDLKKHGAIWQDFWDGLVAESRRKEKGIPYEEYRVRRLKDHRRRG